MKTKNNDIENILILIDKRINKLKTEKNTRITIERWVEIQNNLEEDFNNLVDLEDYNDMKKGRDYYMEKYNDLITKN
jgi:hypothetical protein|tara:strand:+ start:523 stop:753 length:231 start_codon:yes stop_codon:yes gene_type:complete